MAIWQERLAKNITASLHGGELQHYDNYLDLNDQGFEADRLQSWDDCPRKCRPQSGRLAPALHSSAKPICSAGTCCPGKRAARSGCCLSTTSSFTPSATCGCSTMTATSPKKPCALQEQASQSLAALDPTQLAGQHPIQPSLCLCAIRGKRQSPPHFETGARLEPWAVGMVEGGRRPQLPAPGAGLPGAFSRLAIALDVKLRPTR